MSGIVVPVEDAGAGLTLPVRTLVGLLKSEHLLVTDSELVPNKILLCHAPLSRRLLVHTLAQNISQHEGEHEPCHAQHGNVKVQTADFRLARRMQSSITTRLFQIHHSWT